MLSSSLSQFHFAKFRNIQDAPEVRNIITRFPLWPFLLVAEESCFWVSGVKGIT